MRIAHVVESLDIGGLEHVVVALATAQRQRGHEVRILCLWHRGALAVKAEAAGVAVESCAKRDGLDWRALHRLRQFLRAFSAEVLHTHNPMAQYYAAAASVGMRMARRLNSRHGMGSGDLGARRERLYRLALFGCDTAVSVCEAAKQRFVAHGVMPLRKAEVVRNGIDLRRFVTRDDVCAAQLRRTLGLPQDALVFGTVGRLTEVKQQSRLLDALSALQGDGVAASLVIAGDGELRASLEAQVRDLGLEPAVRFLGARDDVPALLSGMDVFVLPSRTEGYSLALVEASAAALPIIATAVGGNAEIVQHGVTGLIVPAGDDQALVNAMRRVASDGSLRAAMGAQARAWALREGSLDAMCDSYLRLYGLQTGPAGQGSTDAVAV